jgi:glyoxylase-like metal-dependent hydrolase (beta-lactamase superfamily II)
LGDAAQVGDGPIVFHLMESPHHSRTAFFFWLQILPDGAEDRFLEDSSAVKRVIKGVHLVPMGFANAFVIEGEGGLTLIDAGYPAKEAAVFAAIRRLGYSADQLKHLIFTHGHPDHIGSAAAIVRETSARTYMHPLDISIAESGGPFRPMTAAPGLLRRALCKLFYHPNERLAPVTIDQPLTAGEILPIAGGIKVIYAPGHCAGQVALLWHPGRMLFASDVCMNVMSLGDPLGFESLEEGRSSQRKLDGLSFDAAGFGHGEPIARDASSRFRNKYGDHSEDVHQERSAA